MRGSDFMMDEINCGNFFDQMDDLFECPADSDCGIGSGAGEDFPSIWSNTSDAFPGSDPIFTGNHGHSHSASHLSAELSVPYEDIVQLEWLSNFVEDSFSGRGMTMSKEHCPMNNETTRNQFQISSPVSVLESSSSSTSSCSRGKTMPIRPTPQGLQRARSKRPRPATFNLRPAIELFSMSEKPQPFPVPVLSSESENFAESGTKNKIPKAAAEQHKKKKKTKLSLPLDSADKNQNQPQQAVRKCLHCEITKTPQWRAGPMGPKTLCNACGVRYKSGRLFPEYRPAASPTFIASLHSNSHKKVVEMRSIGNEISSLALIATTTPTTSEPEHPNIGNERSSLELPVTTTLATTESELIPNILPSLDCK